MFSFCFGLIIDGDVVSKAEIKKTYRNIIFVEDNAGNLVKYVRDIPTKKQKRNAKCDAEKKPVPAPPTVLNNEKPKRNEKLKPASTIEVASMKKLDCLSEEENANKRELMIKKIQMNVKELPIVKICGFMLYAHTVQPGLKFIDHDIDFQSVTDDVLELMNEFIDSGCGDSYNNYNNNNDDLDASAADNCDLHPPAKFHYGNLLISMPDINGEQPTITISEPLWQTCVFNPLHNPMFVVGDEWKFSLNLNGDLIIQLPEVDGKIEQFIITDMIWLSWIGLDSKSLNAIQNGNTDEYNSNNNSLSFINTSGIAQLLIGDETISEILASSLFTDSELDKANNSSVIDQTIPFEKDNEYDASYEDDSDD